MTSLQKEQDDSFHKGTHHPASAEASTSQVQLPNQKTYLTSLSILAFLSGIGIATVVTVRRGRQMAAEDLVEGAKRAARSQSSIANRAVSGAKDGVVEGAQDSPMGRASSKGIMSLFVEMNRAAFSKKARSQMSDKDNRNMPSANMPSALLRSKAPSPTAKSKEGSFESVFDAQASAPPPTILMRAKDNTKQQKEGEARSASEERNHGDNAPEEETHSASIGELPAFMAIKALGIATAVVGTATWLSVEIGCRLLNVRNVDELAEKLTQMVPSSTRGKRALGGIGDAARQVLGGESLSDEAGATKRDAALAEHKDAPLSTEDALDALDAAVERGDAGAWAATLEKQLDAERARDLAERRRRIAEARQKPSSYSAAY